ncbi:MAG: hypothetical protein V1736_10990 [Pseudomonadota bacterium]
MTGILVLPANPWTPVFTGVTTFSRASLFKEEAQGYEREANAQYLIGCELLFQKYDAQEDRNQRVQGGHGYYDRCLTLVKGMEKEKRTESNGNPASKENKRPFVFTSGRKFTETRTEDMTIRFPRAWNMNMLFGGRYEEATFGRKPHIPQNIKAATDGRNQLFISLSVEKRYPFTVDRSPAKSVWFGLVCLVCLVALFTPYATPSLITSFQSEIRNCLFR